MLASTSTLLFSPQFPTMPRKWFPLCRSALQSWMNVSLLIYKVFPVVDKRIDLLCIPQTSLVKSADSIFPSFCHCLLPYYNYFSLCFCCSCFSLCCWVHSSSSPPIYIFFFFRKEKILKIDARTR